jgi:hypothetical protein
MPTGLHEADKYWNVEAYEAQEAGHDTLTLKMV